MCDKVKSNIELGIYVGETMETIKSRLGGMNSNQLKIIALLAMTCDHIGKQLLPQITILQIIGRLAFPIFAYMIAEGCVHTKSQKKYLFTMAGLAAVCQVVYFVAMGSLYQCVLVTFSIAIGLIFLLEYAGMKRTILAYAYSGLGIVTAAFVCIILPWILADTDFCIDYGFLGVFLPVSIYLGKSRRNKIMIMTVMLVLLALKMGGIQWYALLAPLLMALYNGERGKLKMKHLFYIYYPLHLIGIYIIGLVVF